MNRHSTRAGIALCSLTFLCVASVAGADESAEEIIESCRESGNADARIACLEAALRGEAPPAPAPSSPEPDHSRPQDIGQEQVEARNKTREQQLADLEKARDLKVASYSEVPYQRIVVHLENGQVWRQLAGDNQYFRVNLERNQTVNISETPLGGYQLRFNQLRRTIRVERIK